LKIGDESQAFKRSSTDIMADYRKMAATPEWWRNDGDGQGSRRRRRCWTHRSSFSGTRRMEP
jgi:hypothetical protein